MPAQWIDRCASTAKLEERRLRYHRSLQESVDVSCARYYFGRLVEVERELARRSFRHALTLARDARHSGEHTRVVHFLTLAHDARESFRVAGSARVAIHL